MGCYLVVCFCLFYVKLIIVYVIYFVILGGIIDIVVYKIMEDEILVEVYKVSGGDWGGIIVDVEFKVFVIKLFKNEYCIDKLWELVFRDVLEFERDFEVKK